MALDDPTRRQVLKALAELPELRSATARNSVENALEGAPRLREALGHVPWGEGPTPVVSALWKYLGDLGPAQRARFLEWASEVASNATHAELFRDSANRLRGGSIHASDPSPTDDALDTLARRSFASVDAGARGSFADAHASQGGGSASGASEEHSNFGTGVSHERGAYGKRDPRAPVLVSYSHANEAAVIELVTTLRARGANVIYDLDEEAPPQGWAVWVEKHYTEAPLVIFACSPEYRRAFDARLNQPQGRLPSGRGVAHEAYFVRSDALYDGAERFVPVLLPGAEHPRDVPEVAKSQTHYRWPADLEKLLGRLARAQAGPAPTGSPGNAAAGDSGAHPQGASNGDSGSTASAAGSAASTPSSVRPEGADSRSSALPSPPGPRDSRLDALDAHRERRIAQWKKAPFELPEQFVDLTLTIPTDEKDTPRSFHHLEALLESVKSTAVLLHGEPGAGKSTLLGELEHRWAERSLAKDAAVEDRERRVFFVPLNRYPRDSKPALLDWMSARLSKEAPGLPSLSEALQTGGVVLLLDGLNEMRFGEAPEDRFRAFAELTQDLPPGNRLILSCRTADLVGSLGAIPRAKVEPLAPERVRELVQKRLSKHGSPGIADKVMKALADDATLELYRNPYFLSLLVKQVGSDGEVPTDRAALFSGFVSRAIERELQVSGKTIWSDRELLSESDRRAVNARRDLPKPYAEGQGALLPALGRLAFTMQNEGPGEWRACTASSARRALGVDGALSDRVIRAAVDLRVLAEDEVEGELKFAGHQLVQEYFAARAWVVEGGFERAVRPYRRGDPALGPPLREVMEALGPGEELPARKASGWEATAMMAASMAKDDGFLERLAQADLITAARAALVPHARAGAKVKDSLRTSLAEWLRDPAIDLRARIEAGQTLDEPERLGYVRGVSAEGHAFLLPPTAVVTPGRYVIGSEPDEPGAWENETPRRTVTIPAPFELARYPVTNAEYACFMAAKDYADDRWWPKGEARDWRDEKRPDTESEAIVDEIKGMSREQVEELTLHSWTRETRATVDLIRSLERAEAIKLISPQVHPARARRPRFWKESAYQAALQPVVGVCAFEAEAFAAWLSHASGRDCALPTEVEWEVAARRKTSRKWTFGSAFEPERGNTREGHVRRPTPVGAYPEGRTPEGLEDLSGNVWEWTSSAWTSSHAADAETNPTRRVVRGGSWSAAARGARCACRSVHPPGSRLETGGFRLRFVPHPDL